jgi:hypothetical protein
MQLNRFQNFLLIIANNAGSCGCRSVEMSCDTVVCAYVPVVSQFKTCLNLANNMVWCSLCPLSKPLLRSSIVLAVLKERRVTLGPLATFGSHIVVQNELYTLTAPNATTI